MVLYMTAPAHAKNIRVFAAASLREGLNAVADGWEKLRPDAPVIAVYAASSAQAKQIEEGAPADVFFSADVAWMDDLAAKKLIREETRANILGNRLVIIAAPDNPVTLDFSKTVDLASALSEGQLALANVKAVPAGRYAKAALENLKLWDSVKDRIVETESVRAALAYVARGEVALGIVYASDAQAGSAVHVAGTIPEESHPAIIYPAAVTTGSESPDAEAFVDYLQSDAAKAIFYSFGFQLLED